LSYWRRMPTTTTTSEPRFGAIKGNYVALIRTMQAEELMQPDDLKLNAVVRVGGCHKGLRAVWLVLLPVRTK
jgi:hypothetical protein